MHVFFGFWQNAHQNCPFSGNFHVERECTSRAVCVKTTLQRGSSFNQSAEQDFVDASREPNLAIKFENRDRRIKTGPQFGVFVNIDDFGNGQIRPVDRLPSPFDGIVTQVAASPGIYANLVEPPPPERGLPAFFHGSPPGLNGNPDRNQQHSQTDQHGPVDVPEPRQPIQAPSEFIAPGDDQYEGPQVNGSRAKYQPRQACVIGLR